MPTRSLRRIFDAGRTTSVPRLLVSVRSADEATRAIRGGADILDIKEPARGSLGMADIQVIRNITKRVAEIADAPNSTAPISVALGELHEWAQQVDFPSLPPEVVFAKLGLSRLSSQGRWTSDWQRVREKFNEDRDEPLRWVGVAYADAQAANAPAVDDVLAAAIDAGCAGLLIDTFAKRGATLLDLSSPDELNQTAERCHSAGLFFAIAGRVSLSDLPKLSGITADVVAIRSAACVASDRESQVDGTRIAAFRQAMIREFSPQS